jgi:translation initiation factor 1A
MGKTYHKGCRRASAQTKRELIMKTDDQAYARVEKMLGNGRLLAKTETRPKEDTLCKIRGSMRRSEWISVGDIILVALRDFQDDKADVLHVYRPDEVRLLSKWNMLQDLPSLDQQQQQTHIDDDTIEFCDDDVDDI